jgi:transposase
VAAQKQRARCIEEETRRLSGSGIGVEQRWGGGELGDGSGQPAGVGDSVAADAERGRDGEIAARESMLSQSPATRVFVALNPVDMRRSFNGLYAEVQSVLKEDPLSGHLFVFTNRLKNRIKVIFFDGSGLWICAKRLERGTFGWPTGEGVSCSLRPEQLQLLLHGIEGTSRRRWYRR